MTDENFDALLGKDWAAAWDELEAAPSFVRRPKDAQVTLRLSRNLVARIRAVAKQRGLAYHPMVRSWLVDGLHRPSALDFAPESEPQSEQLNIKLDADLLDAIKKRSAALRTPYHAVVRGWIRERVEREEAELGVPASHAGPGVQELIVLLLHSQNRAGAEAIRGMTRLQKLLFVVEQGIGGTAPGYYAFDYGPFNDAVVDATNALRLAGFLTGDRLGGQSMPSFFEMVESAERHSGPRRDAIDIFELSTDGHRAAEELRRSGLAYERLYEYISRLRRDWDEPELGKLVHRVYETWPHYAERSLIRDELDIKYSRPKR